jgi:hypothetical protein
MPGSDRWHYDNRPVCNPDARYLDYCRKGDCASTQIDRQFRVLLEDRRPRAEALMAARFMIHIVGDIHQPLHAAENADKGANDIVVRLPGEAQDRKLHSVWDSTLVRRGLEGQPEEAYAKALLERFRQEIPSWQKGRVRQWMRESSALSRWNVYGPLAGFACGQSSPGRVELDEAYLRSAQDIVPGQLVRAGARIAWMLERAFPR